MASPSQPDTRRTTRTGAHRGIALPLTGAILLAVGVMSGLAGADTPTTHAARATTATQSNVAPPGPLTGLADLSSVTIRVTQAGPTDQITGIVAVRQCKPGLAIVNSAELTPSNTGFCLKNPLSAGSNNLVSNVTKASPSDTFIETTFKVGTGTQTYDYDDGTPQQSTITCDDTNNCSLWVQIARSGGNDFVHFDLDFGTPTTTTTGATTTSSTVVTTTSTTAATTTTTGGGTTTTTAGGTTSTTAGGTTSSTTSTTLPSGTTVAPSAAVGGAIAVTSTGWDDGATVTGTLNSTPVVLGALVASSTGTISGTYPVPASVPSGAHTLVLTGTGANGQPRTVSAGVTITNTSSSSTTATSAGGGIPRTGRDVFRLGTSGLLVAIAGALFVTAAVQRRIRLGSRR